MRCFAGAVLWVVAIIACGEANSEPRQRYVPSPEFEDGWYARIETNHGRIVVRLLPEQSPQAVAHFAGLAMGTLDWFDPVTGELQKGRYYDGITIDLAEAGQRFEAGGLSGDADRVPPTVWISPDEGHGPYNFSRPGRMGMTRSQGARVSGVKFFVTAAALPHLNGHHPCFGEVVEGDDVVFQITQVKTYSNGRPVEPVKIKRIRLFSIGAPIALPEPKAHRPTLKPFRGKDNDKDEEPGD